MTTVSKVMSGLPRVIGAHVPVPDAQALATRFEVHHLLVVEGGRLVGEVCVRDLDAALPTDSVQSVMKSPVVSVAPDSSAGDALELMRSAGVGCLAVINANGRLVGVLTHRDLRRVGILPGEKGVDLCASCGQSHHLAPPEFPGAPVFCGDCLAQTVRPYRSEMYFTLGGGD